MIFETISVFPGVFDAYLSASIMGRAANAGKRVLDLVREHRRRPYRRTRAGGLAELARRGAVQRHRRPAGIPDAGFLIIDAQTTPVHRPHLQVIGGDGVARPLAGRGRQHRG